MSKQLAIHTAPTDLQVTDDGQLFIYLSDMLEDTDPASQAGVAWAMTVVNDEGDGIDHNLALTLDLPKAIEELLEFSNESSTDKILPAEDRSKIMAIRNQLQAALDLIDKVQFKE